MHSNLANLPSTVQDKFQKIAGANTNSPKYVDVGLPAIPTIDVLDSVTESLLLTYTGPTGNSSSPNVLFNDDELLEKINSANGFTVNNWGAIVTSASGTPTAQLVLEVGLRTATDTVTRICGWMTANVASPDAVRFGVWDLEQFFQLKKEQHWNQDQVGFQQYVLTNLNFRVQNHAAGSCNISNAVIELTLHF